MPTGSHARSVARLLASAGAPLWIITADRRIGYVSAAAAQWFGVDGDELIDRPCSSGVAASDHRLDKLAASLSPPAGLAQHGVVVMHVQPTEVAQGSDVGESQEIAQPSAREVIFIRVGDAAMAVTLAVAGEFPLARVDSPLNDSSLRESVEIRQQLDAWRKRHAALAVTVSAGTSSAAKRLRARLQIAAKIRCHLGFFGPTGCGAEVLAHRIHQLSAPGESLIVVEGPLMDSELLDATIAPAIHQLAESRTSTASLLVRALDEMPMEAQSRLAEVVIAAAGRLRLIGLCSPQPTLFREPINAANDAAANNAAANDAAANDAGALHHATGSAEQTVNVLEPRLAECLSVLSVSVEPLGSRVEDLPLLAAALLDARHAAKEGPGERLSRGALDAIVKYPWPGNFVELDATIRHAIRACASDVIAPEHLPLAVRSYRSVEVHRPETPSLALDVAVGRYEWKLIQAALVASDDNRAEAARRLGISRSRLLRKIDEAADDSSNSKSAGAS